MVAEVERAEERGAHEDLDDVVAEGGPVVVGEDRRGRHAGVGGGVEPGPGPEAGDGDLPVQRSARRGVALDGEHGPLEVVERGVLQAHVGRRLGPLDHPLVEGGAGLGGEHLGDPLLERPLGVAHLGQVDDVVVVVGGGVVDQRAAEAVVAGPGPVVDELAAEVGRAACGPRPARPAGSTAPGGRAPGPGPCRCRGPASSTSWASLGTHHGGEGAPAPPPIASRHGRARRPGDLELERSALGPHGQRRQLRRAARLRRVRSASPGGPSRATTTTCRRTTGPRRSASAPTRSTPACWCAGCGPRGCVGPVRERSRRPGHLPSIGRWPT